VLVSLFVLDRDSTAESDCVKVAVLQPSLFSADKDFAPRASSVSPFLTSTSFYLHDATDGPAKGSEVELRQRQC
jgi:hypothetical protein